MTYVIGAKCKDGVVIIGDRKVTFAGDIQKTRWEKKIRSIPQFPPVVFAAAGAKDLFEEFLNELPRRIKLKINYFLEQNKERPESMHVGYTLYDFKHDCVELLKDMKETYSEIGNEEYAALQVLFAINNLDTNKAILYFMDSNSCFPIEVGGILPIGDPAIGEVFRKNWDENMTLEQTAKLGAFIIKYIEKAELSEVIGVGEYKPQIWFVKNGGLPQEIAGDELDKMLKGLDEKVEETIKSIKSFSGFLGN